MSILGICENSWKLSLSKLKEAINPMLKTASELFQSNENEKEQRLVQRTGGFALENVKVNESTVRNILKNWEWKMDSKLQEFVKQLKPETRVVFVKMAKDYNYDNAIFFEEEEGIWRLAYDQMEIRSQYFSIGAQIDWWTKANGMNFVKNTRNKLTASNSLSFTGDAFGSLEEEDPEVEIEVQADKSLVITFEL